MVHGFERMPLGHGGFDVELLGIEVKVGRRGLGANLGKVRWSV